MPEPTHTAVGTWSGGRFMHFGEPLDDDAAAGAAAPGRRHRAPCITADAYGAGEADALLGRALRGRRRATTTALVGAIGHDFYDGRARGREGLPALHRPARCAGPTRYADYVRMATERSLERSASTRFDLLLLHNPDRTGYTSEAVWDGMAALRDAGLTRRIGVAPGPGERLHARPDRLLRALRRRGSTGRW